MRSLLLAGAMGVAFGCPATAAVVAFTDQSSFAAALTGEFTLVDFDTLGGFAAGYRLDDAAPAAALAALGVDSVGLNAQVAGGQNYQTPTDRDRLILNGARFGGQIAFDFASAVNGVGAYANFGDGGRIRLFSGAGLTGDFLGEVQFGPGAFGGGVADGLARSAQITCDFNSDLACGVYDLQFGTVARSGAGAVPEPGAWALMILGFASAGAMLRRRRAAPLAARA